MNASRNDHRFTACLGGDCTRSRIQQAVAWGLSMSITVAVLASLSTLAGGYQADAQLAAQRSAPASQQARWVGEQQGLASGGQHL